MKLSIVPETIGPYRVLRPIARGGMAEVFEVEDPITGEHLALKLLMQTGGALPRFNREYEAMIRLNHPNIVRVFNYGFHQKMPWLTMELVDGTPVQAYAKRCGRAGSEGRNREVIRVAHDLALALDHIHRRGLVHRDLKSANVLVLPDGRVKLLDFGTARVANAVEEITRDGEFIGTFAYASPEQLTGKPVDGRADLYSLGVLLYRMCTAKMVFESNDLQELARMHVRRAPRAPRELVADLPEALNALILSLLAKDPADRPQTGDRVARALEELAGEPLLLPGTLDVDQSSERMVGREAEMKQLRQFLDGAAAGGEAAGAVPGDLAMVVGLQGSGRHRIMQALEKDVRDRNWLLVNCFFRRGRSDIDAVSLTLQTIGRALDMKTDLAVRTAMQTLKQVEGELRMALADRMEALREAARVLLVAAATPEKPVVLMLRGLQNAGTVGFELTVGLREIIRETGVPVLMLADCHERADDPQSIARKRLPDALRVYLAPMDEREVALLVGSLLNRRPPPASVARQIYQASGGLPSYVEEVVKGMVSGGLLRVQTRDANRIEWAQQEDIEIPVPESARRRVVDQLAELPADRRRVLEVLALAGGEGALPVLAHGLGSKPDQIRPAVLDLVQRGWVTISDERGTQYLLWRQILAESVVLEQLNPCRRKVFERYLIDLLASEPAFTAQINLLLDVGRLEEALQRALDWGVHHLTRHRPVTALDVLDKVVAALDARKDFVSVYLAQLYLLHVTALLLARPTDPQLARSLALATRFGKYEGEVFEAELQLARARIQRVIGHYANFRKYLVAAWGILEHAPPTPLGATVADLLGWSNRLSGLVDDAAAWHGRSRRIAVQLGIPAVQAMADVGVGGWQLSRGLLNEAERTVVASVRVFDEVHDTRGVSQSLPIWAESLRLQGRYSEGLAVLSQQLPLMREGQVPTHYVRILLATASIELDLCRLGRAQECIDELAATLRKGEHLDLRLLSDLFHARILIASDQPGAASRLLQVVQQRAEAAGLNVLGARAQVALGEATWLLGDQKAAVQHFREAVGALRKFADAPALLEACAGMAKMTAEVFDPDATLAPVADLLDHQPVLPAHLERSIRRLQHAQARSRDDEARRFGSDASRLLMRLAAALSETDRAALRLHPWTQTLRLHGIKPLDRPGNTFS